MAKEYTSKQLRELYIKLPEELKEALSSDETADTIEKVCKKNEITDERVSAVADLTGYVLRGVLPPDQFREELEKETKIEKGIAKKITQEINRFIFYPVKRSLEDIYSMEITPPAQMEIPGPMKKKTVEKGKKDTYREPVE